MAVILTILDDPDEEKPFLALIDKASAIPLEGPGARIHYKLDLSDTRNHPGYKQLEAVLTLLPRNSSDADLWTLLEDAFATVYKAGRDSVEAEAI